MMNNEDYKPWVEKYRPDRFKDIVLKKTIRSSYKILLNKTTFQILFFMDHRNRKNYYDH